MTETLTEIKRKSVVGAVSYFARTAVLQIIGLGSVFTLGFLLSPEDFGIYGFVTQIIGILIFFSDIGLAAALIQKKTPPTDEELAVVFTVQQILSWLIVSVAVLLIASGLIEAKTGLTGVWVMLSLALSFPLATLKTISSVKLERKLEFNKLVIPQIIEQIVFHGILIYLAWNKFGALAYAYAVIFRSMAGVVTLYILAPWKPRLSFRFGIVKSLVSYGAIFQINDFLARIKDQLFYAVLGWFLPLQQFGYINWAKGWSMYPYNLTVQNVMAVTFPTFSRLQNEPKLLRKAIETALFFISLAIFPILAGMSVFVFPFVHLVEGYQKWEPALWSLVFFSLSIGWGAISTPLTNTLNATGHISKTLKLMSIWTTLTWILTPLCYWWFGFTGVSIAAFLISCTSILSIWYTQEVIEFTVWPHIWRQLLASVVLAVVGIVGIPVWEQSFLTLALGILLSGLAFLGMMWVLGRREVEAHIRVLLKASKSPAQTS